MKRKVLDNLISWKNDSQRKALLLRGCRQIGKTYIIREFLKDNYSGYIEINLEKNRDLHMIFQNNDRSAKSIIDRLLFDVKPIGKMIDGKSAIFIDEIQACPAAYSSLKALSDEGRFDIISSGSLLGVLLDDLQYQSPLGYVNAIDMYPLDFEEFLWAMGIEPEYTKYIENCIQSFKPLDKYILDKTSELFRRYLVVGGMPAAVLKYSTTRDYTQTRKVLKDIADLIGQDAQKYSSGPHRFRIEACLRSIPEQLAQENKKFQYHRVEKKKHAGKATYGQAIDWLKKANVAYLCHNVTEPTSPLTERTIDNIFKIYTSDTGILMALTEENIEGTIVNRDPFANNGAVMENAIACALRSKGYMLRYYSRMNSTLEVDFIVNFDGDITAIEIKSGKKKKSKSLHELFSNTRTVKRAIKLAEGNVFRDENGVEHYPLFGPCFFKGSDISDLEPMDSIDLLNQRFKEILTGPSGEQNSH